MLRIVWAALWLQEREYILSYTEEIGDHGDELYKVNAESARDGEKDESKSDAEGGYL